MQALTLFREHLFDIRAAVDVMDAVSIDLLSIGLTGDYIFTAGTEKRRQMTFEIFIFI